MGEFLLLVLTLSVFCLTGAALAVVALVRMGRLERELRQELHRLRQELRAVESAPVRESPRARPVEAARPVAPPTPVAVPSSVEPPTVVMEPATVIAEPATVIAEPVAPALVLPEPAPTLAASAPSRATAQPAVARPAVEEARPRRSKIDWERWLGVRGAAMVGGVFLALAAIFFFKHAFTQGWISPTARVASGVVAGLAAILAAAQLRRRAFGWAPSALEGAGVVALYASVWAAQQRYGLLSQAVAFPLMAVITALACVLALRHGSLFSALLGLAGGFATPLLLSVGEPRPLPLFGYLLLLDLGLLLVARRRGWVIVALLAIGGTLLFEALMLRMGVERSGPGLAVRAAFALLFAACATWTDAAERRRWLVPQGLGVLASFVFGLYFARDVELGPHVWPIALFAAMLVVAAALIARQQAAPWLASAAALAGAAVIAPALLGGRAKVPAGWELAAVAAGLTLVSHALAEWEGARGDSRGGWRVSATAAACAWGLLVLVALTNSHVWGFAPALCALLVLGAALVRQAALHGLAPALWSAGFVLGGGLGFVHGGYAVQTWRSDPSLPAPLLFWALPLALAALFLFALPRAQPRLARGAAQGAGVLLASFALLAALGGGFPGVQVWLPPAAGVVLGALLLSAAIRLASSAWTAVCVASLGLQALVGLFLLHEHPPASAALPWAILLAYLAQLIAVAWLASGARELDPRRWAWAWLFALVWLLAPAVREAYVQACGTRTAGAALLLAGLPAAACALRLRARGAPARAIGWIAASAALAASSALAALLHESELAVSTALFAVALAWIAHRLALPAAAWCATASGALSALVLLAMAFEPEAYARSGHLLANWISYAHLVPAAALAGALAVLPRDAGRGLAAHRRPVLGGAVALLVFLWLNLLIENAFASTPRLTLGEAGGHGRDLATSLAWGLFAGGLLVLGTARHASALRWTSLASFVLTIGKVFLHDLAHLDGLYRVASLAGMALSLLAVSLFYQRFVFGRVEGGAARS